MKDIAIYGAGGFGREILALIRRIIRHSDESYNIGGFFDDGLIKGGIVSGVPVIGEKKEINGYEGDLFLAVAVGDPHVRQEVVSSITNPRIQYPVLIDPSVILLDSESIKISEGSIICAGVNMTCNISVGSFSILNLQCTVGHDAVIEDFVSLMPGVNISGETAFESGVYVGTGARILQQIRIGRNSVIGAGSVVTKDIPENVVAYGNPCRTIRLNK